MDDISFSLFVQKSRRKLLVNSIIGDKQSSDHKDGTRIRRNLVSEIEREKEERRVARLAKERDPFSALSYKSATSPKMAKSPRGSPKFGGA